MKMFNASMIELLELRRLFTGGVEDILSTHVIQVDSGVASIVVTRSGDLDQPLPVSLGYSVSFTHDDSISALSTQLIIPRGAAAITLDYRASDFSDTVIGATPFALTVELVAWNNQGQAFDVETETVYLVAPAVPVLPNVAGAGLAFIVAVTLANQRLTDALKVNNFGAAQEALTDVKQALLNAGAAAAEVAAFGGKMAAWIVVCSQAADDAEEIAEGIAMGHAGPDHGNELLGGKLPSDPAEALGAIADAIKNAILGGIAGGNVKSGPDGKKAYYDPKTGIVVIIDPSSPDGGTAFKPTRGKGYFDDLFK